MSKKILKIILIGDSNVGKTCLVRRYLENQYRETGNTIGLEYATKVIEINSESVTVRIWDTAGQEKYQSLVETYFTGTDGALVVFDICSKESFSNTQMWISKLHEKCPDLPAILLVGSKYDLEENRVVTKEEVAQYAHEKQMDYIDTSAKTGENVQEAFYQIVYQAYNHFVTVRLKSLNDRVMQSKNLRTNKKCSC